MTKAIERAYHHESGQGLETSDGYLGGYTKPTGAFIMASVQTPTGRTYTGSFEKTGAAMAWVRITIRQDRARPRPPSIADIDEGRAPRQ